VFPPQLEWFRSNRDFANIATGLARAGFSQDDIDAVMAENWLRSFERSFTPRHDIGPGAVTAMAVAIEGRG
jgi:hypothetical protein